MPVMNKAIYISETKGVIEIKAPGKTDFFIDMFTMKQVDDAPFYYEKRKDDFVARVKVRPDLK